MRIAVCLASLLLASAAAAHAVPAPTLLGRWEMDLNRTVMWKKAVRPTHRVDTVELVGDQIHWSWRALEPKGPFEAAMRLFTDGRWSQNTVAGHRCRSRASWQGDTLVVDSHGRFLLVSWHLQDRIHVAEEGRELRATRRFRMATMNEIEHWVYRRADG